ncbi:hypothetical protein CAEBREN_23515 [Caenorhabditis brenneri]|uniref:T-box domain-containing protein n=1 Tax=Caenorhabditis brenneri TaxID=135651 RepID=G0MBD1_CAEBE|nr:hypothetical protein CAEBREN_23515 [Caenorhabditis brenneri]
MNLDDLKVSLVPKYDFFWKYFDEHFEHVMTISKLSRPVFPYLNYQVTGFEPNTKYSICLHFELTNSSQFKCKEGKWLPVGEAAEHGPSKQVRHERGVLSGRDWMETGVSFQLVRISRDFKSSNESEIQLHINHKYRPVLSIREEPTPEKPNPTVIQCRLGHTEFITVVDIQNKLLRSLKLLDKNGYMERKTLWGGTVPEPPIFATCSLENASNQTVTLTPQSTGLEDGISFISNHQEKSDGTQKKNIIKNSTTSSGSAHPLSVEKLYLLMDKKEMEEKKTIESSSTGPIYVHWNAGLMYIPTVNIENPKPIQEPESIQRNGSHDRLQQLEAARHPAAMLTPGVASPGKCMKRKKVEEVIRVKVAQDGQKNTVAPTPAIEPPRKKLRIELDRGERYTKGGEEVVCHSPTHTKCTVKNASDVSKTPSTSELGLDHSLNVSNVELFCRNCPPDLLEEMKAMTPQEAMHIDIGQFFKAYFTQGITRTSDPIFLKIAKRTPWNQSQ